MLGSKPDENILLTLSVVDDVHNKSNNFVIVQLCANGPHPVELFVEVFFEADDDDIVVLVDLEESFCVDAQRDAVQRLRFEERTKNTSHCYLLSSYMAGYPYKR